MNKWSVFFKERAPVASYIIMCLGPTLSSIYLNQKNFDLKILFSFFGLFIFFNVLRMMDEYKDYHKDVIAHPTRPLPRGLIDLKEFKIGINLGLIIMLVFNLSLFFVGLKLSFFLYSLVVIHLWLMYKEFYIGDWLNQYPIIYAITHQLILISLMLFSLSTIRNQSLAFHTIDWVFSLSVLFSFFTYEVCRKLDPNAHELLKTYRHIYGLGGVLLIVSVLLSLHFLTLVYFYQKNLIQIILEALLILIFSLLVFLKFNKIKFKIVEGVATLNLIIFLYSGIIYAITNY
jgi:4-hydroxybenzoate polyprenyltransferase